MKQLVLAISCAVAGGIIGSLCTTVICLEYQRNQGVVSASSFILLDESGQQAATLSAGNGGAVLRLIDVKDQTTAVALGVEHSQRFLNFYSDNAAKVVGLVSVPPSFTSALYLGDERVVGRIYLGASLSEDGRGEFTDRWYMQFKNPHNFYESLFRVLTFIDTETGKPKAVLQLNDTHKTQLP